MEAADVVSEIEENPHPKPLRGFGLPARGRRARAAAAQCSPRINQHAGCTASYNLQPMTSPGRSFNEVAPKDED
jgi:hypothetical protein